MPQITRDDVSFPTRALLVEKFAALAKRAEKLGLALKLVKDESFKVEVVFIDGNEWRILDVVTEENRCTGIDRKTVVARGYAVRVVEHFNLVFEFPDSPLYHNGHTLIALAQPVIEDSDVTTAEHRIITSLVEGHGHDLNFARSEKLTCGHCKATRRRNTVAIVERPDKTLLTLGTDCLTYYVPMAANSIAILETIEAFRTLRDAEDPFEEEFGGGSRGKPVWSLDSILTLACDLLNHFPFVSGKAASLDMTKTSSKTDMLTNILFLSPMNRTGHEMARERKTRFANEAYVARVAREVEATKAWAASLEGKNDFEANMKAAFAAEVVSVRTLGLVIAAVACSRRDNEAREARKAFRNEYVGTLAPEGEPLTKVSFPVAKCVGHSVIERGRFGDGHRIAFRLPEGQLLIWWASKPPQGYNNGDTVEILDASIKAHEEYKGTKQTVLTRCDVVTEAVKAERAEGLKKFEASEVVKKAIVKAAKAEAKGYVKSFPGKPFDAYGSAAGFAWDSHKADFDLDACNGWFNPSGKFFDAMVKEVERLNKKATEKAVKGAAETKTEGQ
jgi:hypothetical protein